MDNSKLQKILLIIVIAVLSLVVINTIILVTDVIVKANDSYAYNTTTDKESAGFLTQREEGEQTATGKTEDEWDNKKYLNIKNWIMEYL